MTNTREEWPAGQMWVFQGTVAEDATGGTHVCSLTVVPGTGNELEIQGFHFVAGAGAANLFSAKIDDGTNEVQRIQSAVSLSSGQWYDWPTVFNSTGNSLYHPAGSAKVSGTMRLVLSVSTATVSLTHTFSVVCRVKGAPPNSTLADTVGTPVLTFNTQAFFG